MVQSCKVLVVGQGYVGLPLTIAASKVGHKVYGYDKNSVLIDDLKKGKSTIIDFSDGQIEKARSLSGLQFINSIPVDIKFDVVVICVPTPLTEKREPDLSYIKVALIEISQIIQKDTLIILESTVATGTTRQYVLGELVNLSGLPESEIHLAYSPERIDPSNSIWNLSNTPKLLSGISVESINLAYNFYSSFVKTLVVCDSVEIAEMAKLLENSFRLVNISFINEMYILCQKMQIEIQEVIRAASTKPYGFLPFFPSVGIGGHCIPVDPIYLADVARKNGVSSQMINVADEVNIQMPKFFAKVAATRLGNLKGKKIIVIGVAYKPNVADVRETPVESLIVSLQSEGAHVVWHDDLVKVWRGQSSTPLGNDYDLAILATLHDYLDLSKIGDVPILNTQSSIL